MIANFGKDGGSSNYQTMKKSEFVRGGCGVRVFETRRVVAVAMR